MDQKPALQLTDFRHGLINNFAGDQFNHYGIVNPSQDQHLPAERECHHHLTNQFSDIKELQWLLKPLKS